MYMATDINPKALEASQKTAKANKCELELIRMNLASNMRERMRGKVDLLIFNPVSDVYIIIDKFSHTLSPQKRSSETHRERVGLRPVGLVVRVVLKY